MLSLSPVIWWTPSLELIKIETSFKVRKLELEIFELEWSKEQIKKTKRIESHKKLQLIFFFISDLIYVFSLFSFGFMSWMVPTQRSRTDQMNNICCIKVNHSSSLWSVLHLWTNEKIWCQHKDRHNHLNAITHRRYFN